MLTVALGVGRGAAEESTEEHEDDLTQLTQSSQLSHNLIIQDTETIPDTEPPQSRSDVRNVITPRSSGHSDAQKKLTYVTDNAADISKALRDKYQREGCPAHHINLVVKHGFKNVRSASKILKKCKCIVKAIYHSSLLFYDIKNRLKKFKFTSL